MASPRASLRAFLVARFETEGTLPRFVADHFRELSPELSTDSLAALADSFIGVLMERGRIPELWPPLVAERGVYAAEIAGLKTAFVAEAAGETLGSPLHQQPLDPYETCCLTGANLLLNRKGLRKALRDLARPLGKRILVVRDEPPPSLPGICRSKTGKSHTVHFVGYLRDSTGAFKTAPIDLEELDGIVAGGSGAQIQPSDLATELFDRMGLNRRLMPDLPTDGQWSRWVHDCGNRFAAALDEDPSIWWIVIDGFNAVILPQPTLDLVKRIAQVVSLSVGRVRMVLLGYGDTFPVDKVVPYVEIEKLCVALQVEEAVEDLTHFFARACLERDIEPTPDRVAGLVAESLKDLSATLIPIHALAPSALGCLMRLQEG